MTWLWTGTLVVDEVNNVIEAVYQLVKTRARHVITCIEGKPGGLDSTIYEVV